MDARTLLFLLFCTTTFFLPSGTSIGLSVGTSHADALCRDTGFDNGRCTDLGQGETVLATYTDPSTGNTGALVADESGLWCKWEAGYRGYARFDTTASQDDTGLFLPSYYFASCSIRIQGTISCRSDSSHGGGAANGACFLIDYVPKRDLRWSLSVWALEVEIHEGVSWSKEAGEIYHWKADFNHRQELQGKVSFLGARIPVPELFVGQSFDMSQGYEVTSYTTDYQDAWVSLRSRQAMTFSVAEHRVSLAPRISELDWSGRTYGCDALDLIEAFQGPRDIGDYSATLAKQGVNSGTLKGHFESSELYAIHDQGAYTGIVQGLHGFTATVPASNTFRSTILFDVDYQYPEGLGNLAGVLGTSSGLLGYHLEATADNLYAVLDWTDLPPEEIARRSGGLVAEEIERAGGIAQALVLLFLDRPEPVTSLSGCALSAVRHDQTWTLTAALAGAGYEIGRLSTFDVRVHLELV